MKAMATNTAPHGAFRGFGAPQTTFAYERQVDEAAQRLGLDPLSLRRLNALVPGGNAGVTHLPERAGEIRRNYSDIGKARGLLGFDPHTDLLSGLERTRDWFLAADGGKS